MAVDVFGYLFSACKGGAAWLRLSFVGTVPSVTTLSRLTGKLAGDRVSVCPHAQKHRCPPTLPGGQIAALTAGRNRQSLSNRYCSLVVFADYQISRKNPLPAPACRVRLNSFAGKGCRMAQHHKGPRKQVATRIHDDVFEEIRDRSGERGLSMSQWIADVLSAAVGRPDLVRELNRAEREELPLAM